MTNNFEMDFLCTQAQSEATKANDKNAASIMMAQCADCGLFVLFGNLWIACRKGLLMCVCWIFMCCGP